MASPGPRTAVNASRSLPTSRLGKQGADEAQPLIINSQPHKPQGQKIDEGKLRPADGAAVPGPRQTTHPPNAKKLLRVDAEGQLMHICVRPTTSADSNQPLMSLPQYVLAPIILCEGLLVVDLKSCCPQQSQSRVLQMFWVGEIWLGGAVMWFLEGPGAPLDLYNPRTISR
jgi:hypothetical protein